MSGDITTLKHNVRTTLQLSYHGCKNLIHTSKTPHVKRTQMVVTVRFTIQVNSLHRWNKQGTKICYWFLTYYTCGVKLLEYRYAEVWNIAKNKEAEPNRLIPLKPIENLVELSIVHYTRVSYFFRLVRIEGN